MDLLAILETIGLLAVAVTFIAIRLWKRNRGLNILRRGGFDKEEASLILKDIRKGNEDASIERATVTQERIRAALQEETGIDLKTFVPEIGREISWEFIIRHVFRVLEFDKAGTTIGPNDEVKALSDFAPYGFLLVESPILNQPIKLPIIHRDDFWLAASAFEEPELADLVDTDELLVTYAPRIVLPGGLSGEPTHVLHYVMTPKGTLEEYYSKDNDLNMAKPNPRLLFGEFVYEGEIGVQMNFEPKF